MYLKGVEMRKELRGANRTAGVLTGGGTYPAPTNRTVKLGQMFEL